MLLFIALNTDKLIFTLVRLLTTIPLAFVNKHRDFDALVYNANSETTQS